MQVYRDQDADLGILAGKTIAVIGYGNQGRSQALNLRDSGLNIIVGNREDEFAGRARQDDFAVFSLDEAARQADIVMLLIPDEAVSQVFQESIASGLEAGDVLVFASGFNVAFGLITLPKGVDVVLVAPRMIGAGVRDLYVAGQGFPAFIGVEQDTTGKARAIALALAKGIGSTRMGVVEVTFAQEAELDLFTEQCFGPAFGQVLVSAVDLLVEQGYPPEAVLLELYMSGEFAYTLAKIAEMGMVEQTRLHSLTSQYGSLSRGMRFMLPEMRAKMLAGLEEIRSGAFAQEWMAEREAGYPTLKGLQQAARSMPLYAMERELRRALGSAPGYWPNKILSTVRTGAAPGMPPGLEARIEERQETGLSWLRLLRDRLLKQPARQEEFGPLDAAQMKRVLRVFLVDLAADTRLAEFARGKRLIAQYRLPDIGLEFYMAFEKSVVSAGLGASPRPADVYLEAESGVLDGMFTGRIDATRAAFSGRLTFSGDTKKAASIQAIQANLREIYKRARVKSVASEQ